MTAPATGDAADLRQETHRMAAAANFSESICIPGAPVGTRTGCTGTRLGTTRACVNNDVLGVPAATFVDRAHGGSRCRIVRAIRLGSRLPQPELPAAPLSRGL